jgi:hypothetical protein
MGGFSESDVVMLTDTLNQSLFDYVWPVVELAVSPVSYVAAPGNQLTCLQLPTPDAVTHSGDSGGHIQRGFREFFVPGPTLTSWRFANLPHRTI